MAQLSENEEAGADGLPVGFCDIKHCSEWLCRKVGSPLQGTRGLEGSL